MVGTARCAVRAPSGRNVPAALPPGIRNAGQRDVPTKNGTLAHQVVGMARCAVRAPSGRNVPAALPPGIACGTARRPYQKWHPHSSGGRDGARRRPRPNRAQDSGGFTAGDPAMRDSAMSLPKMAPSLIGLVGTARRAVRAPSGRKIPAALPPGTAQRAVPTGFKADARRAVPTFNRQIAGAGRRRNNQTASPQDSPPGFSGLDFAECNQPFRGDFPRVATGVRKNRAAS